MTPGVVVIGRNEGERLRRCFDSIVGTTPSVVYVDSGSTDGSVAMARSMQVEVVELDLRLPFTAARARNAGYRRLKLLQPELACVQFVDGDCELAAGWLEKAAALLDARPDVAMVCGRLRERHPERSIYNLLCDIEWDAPAGRSRACGGIAMARVPPLDASGGYREDLIAGEEPELCLRLRAQGWAIWRLADDMALHDAAMTRFGQWWQRSIRAGYAFAEGAFLHGSGPERHRVRESCSALVWGVALPSTAVLGLAGWGAWGLLPLAAYPLQIVRLGMSGSRPPRQRWLRALFIVLGKFPEAMGNIKFRIHHAAGSGSRLIEYK